MTMKVFTKTKITMIIYINSNPHFLVEILLYDIHVLPPYRIYNNNDDNDNNDNNNNNNNNYNNNNNNNNNNKCTA